jgi:hypothetical protein
MILEELLRYKRSKLAETTWFEDKKHDRFLCVKTEDRLNEILDFFLKYQSITHMIQGLRDQGTDVVLQYSTKADSSDQKKISIQIKSYDDIEKGGHLKDLKAGFFDAKSKYGDSLERYYIILCTNQEKHNTQVKNIIIDFSNEELVRVIEPRDALFFFRMKEEIVSATVDHYLMDDDFVRKQAKKEVVQLTKLEFAIILSVMVSLIEDRSTKLSQESILATAMPRLKELSETHFFGRSINEEIIKTFESLESYLFTSRDSFSEELDFDSNGFKAVNSLILDSQIRYGYYGNQLFEHLFETLSRSVLGDDEYEDDEDLDSNESIYDE